MYDPDPPDIVPPVKVVVVPEHIETAAPLELPEMLGVTVPLTLTVCEDARDEAHVMFAPVGLDPCAFILTVIVVVETEPDVGVNVKRAGDDVVLT